MRSRNHHRAIVISAMFTAFLLAGAVGGLVITNRLSATAADAATTDAVVAQPQAAVSAPAVDNSTEQADAAALAQANAALQQAATDLADKDAVIAAYDARLREAYAALQQAYGQIEQLQAAQSRFGSNREEEHERGERMILSNNQGEIQND